MKRFSVQATVDERQVWEVMRFLEERKATDILARPIFTETYEIEGAKPNGRGKPGHPRPRKGGGMRGIVRNAIMEAIATRERIKPDEIRQATGVTKGAVYQAFHTLLKARVLKRVAPATYVKGSKAP